MRTAGTVARPVAAVGARADQVATRLRDSRPATATRRFVDQVGWPRILLVAAMAGWFTVFAQHVFERHERFGSFDFDLGIYDQAVWLLSQGHSVDTVRGLAVFGNHVNVAFFALVPLYWLGAGPHALNFVMVGSVALGAIPVFAIARHHLRHEWFALVLATAYLLHFTNQWVAQETFHAEVVAMAPLLVAYWFALEERWWGYGLWLAFAVAWKEDIALAALMLGLLLLFRGHKTAGRWTMVGALAWWLLATQVIIPAFSPEGVFYASFFGDLGDSPYELARTAATNPTEITRQLETANAVGYGRDLLLPFGLTALLAPAALLIGLPQALANLLSINSFTWSLRFHYAAVPLVAVTIASIEGVASIKRESLRRFAVGWIGAAALATTVTFGISPVSTLYRDGFWPLTDNPRQAQIESALALPPDDASVTATFNLVPHLTHRRNIYSFPNPWQTSNWGVRGERAHDPESVDWLVIDVATLSPELDDLLDEIVTEPGRWVVMVADDDLLVARRVDAET